MVDDHVAVSHISFINIQTAMFIDNVTVSGNRVNFTQNQNFRSFWYQIVSHITEWKLNQINGFKDITAANTFLCDNVM